MEKGSAMSLTAIAPLSPSEALARLHSLLDFRMIRMKLADAESARVFQKRNWTYERANTEDFSHYAWPSQR
jgi:hypothetical protein